MSILQKLLYSDSISILDFSLVLQEYNAEIGDFIFFSSLIYAAIEAGKLIPLPQPFNHTTPFRERDFKFSPDVLIQWAETKKLNISLSKNEPHQHKWLSAPHYAQEWQTAANKYKKENPKWKKYQIANAIHKDYKQKDINFPHSKETIERNISAVKAKTIP